MIQEATKPQTHIEQRSMKAQSLKHAIIEFVGITEEEYCELQFEMGLDFLEHYISDAKESTRQAWIYELSICKIYWAWWRNQWLLRDEMYMSCEVIDVHQIKDVRIRKMMYLEMNNAEKLANEIHPNGKILDASYAEMLQRYMNSND